MSSAPVDLAAAGAKPRRRFTVDALFTDHRPQAVGVSELPTAKEIQLDRIEPDPDQPRQTIDGAKLRELTDSIRLEGVLQPIAVRYDADRDIYVVIHGERRWRAARAAELAAIPAIVRDVPEDRRLVQQLMENIVRDDLNAIDRAAALRALKLQLGDAPWESVAEAVGIRRSRLFQLLGTEKLPASARDDIRSGRLSEKQSRALQGLPPAQQEALREAILTDDLPAAEAMRLARALRTADLPDDADAVAALAAIRGAPAMITCSTADGDELAPLLAALMTAAGGSRSERAALNRAADAAGADAYDRGRLQAEILALARTLARAPEQELRPGGDAYASLAALCGAIDAVLTSR